MGAKHGDRVAVQLEEEDGTAVSRAGWEGCLPAFRFLRAGLVVDEYHSHGDVPYDDELHKRVDAALSLSRPEDTCE